MAGKVRVSDGSPLRGQDYARGVARRFLNELLRHGTTTALVFGTVHPESVDAFFEEALALNLRMIAGKVLMDSNAPEYLRDTSGVRYADSGA
jgi:guanine deaminase